MIGGGASSDDPLRRKITPSATEANAVSQPSCAENGVDYGGGEDVIWD